IGVPPFVRNRHYFPKNGNWLPKIVEKSRDRGKILAEDFTIQLLIGSSIVLSLRIDSGIYATYNIAVIFGKD
ncbi:MAG: hypothetical protein ACETVZ_00930, partial [Phycisphaerae bacterium]